MAKQYYRYAADLVGQYAVLMEQSHIHQTYNPDTVSVPNQDTGIGIKASKNAKQFGIKPRTITIAADSNSRKTHTIVILSKSIFDGLAKGDTITAWSGVLAGAGVIISKSSEKVYPGNNAY